MAALTQTQRVMIDLRIVLSVTVFAAACATDAVLWPLTGGRLPGGFLILVLVAGVIVSSHIAIPVRSGVRIWLASVPVFLIAALLPPATAMAVMGVSIGANELAICWKCKNTAAQVIGQTGRWMFLALLGSLVAQIGDREMAGLLVIAVLYAGDILTAPLVLPGVEFPGGLKQLFLRSWYPESMQYLSAYLLLPVLVQHGQHVAVVVGSLVVMVLWLTLWVMLLRQSDGMISLNGP